MKEPILLTGSHLSSILTAMLMERGLDSYTLSFDNFGLEGEGDLADDGENYTSVTVTIRKVE